MGQFPVQLLRGALYPLDDVGRREDGQPFATEGQENILVLRSPKWFHAHLWATLKVLILCRFDRETPPIGAFEDEPLRGRFEGSLGFCWIGFGGSEGLKMNLDEWLAGGIRSIATKI